MKIRLLKLWEDLLSSYWFVPGLLLVGAVTLASGLIYADWLVQRHGLSWLNRLHVASPSGARALLSMIAGSAITVAGVVFSITMLVLNMASAQFGPRLLRNFMGHNATQFVLGMFVGTFVYCLIVLSAVRSEPEGLFVPQIAVAAGLANGIALSGLLIYFIHHVSRFIQAERIIGDVAASLEGVLRSSFPARDRGRKRTPDEEEDDAGKNLPAIEDRQPVLARRSGYVQAIDMEGLMAIAKQHDSVIWLDSRPGRYVVQDRLLAHVSANVELDDESTARIAETFIVGAERTSIQDPEFAVHQLVEIALRALSPGINDPFTAINCIDRLGSVLSLLGERELPSRYRRDEEGRIRLVTDPYTYGGVVRAAFNQIRQIAASNAAVIIRLLEVIALIAEGDLPVPYRQELRAQADAIFEVSRDAFPGTDDRKDFEARAHSVITALDKDREAAR